MQFERGNHGSQFIAIIGNHLFNLRKRAPGSPGFNPDFPWQLEIRKFKGAPDPEKKSVLVFRESYPSKSSASHFADVWARDLDK
jgi:hypothetical protein